MQLNSEQQTRFTNLLSGFAPATAELILSRFDEESRNLIRQSLATRRTAGPADDVLQEFAEFLYFCRQPAQSPRDIGPNSGGDRGEPAAPATTTVQIGFQTVLNLDDASIDALLAAAPAELTIQTLCCSPRSFIQRVLARLSDEEAEIVTQRINEAGPRDFDQMQSIQNRYCQFVRKLAEQGTIRLSGTPVRAN